MKNISAEPRSWNISGDGVTKTFPIAGAGYGIFAVTIGGVGQTPDENHDPGAPGGSTGGDDPYDPCVSVDSFNPDEVEAALAKLR